MNAHLAMLRQPFGSAQGFGFGLIFSSAKPNENHVAKKFHWQRSSSK
jgi:hypothetical protein